MSDITTAAETADPRLGDLVWWDGAEWEVIGYSAESCEVTLAPRGGGMSAVVAAETVYSITTADTTLTVTPGPLEVAIVHVPAGFTVSVDYGDGTTRTVPAGTARWYLALPGTGMGWGCQVSAYPVARRIALGKTSADRAEWQRAARQLDTIAFLHPREGAALYVIHEPQDHYGKTVLRAVRARREGE